MVVVLFILVVQHVLFGTESLGGLNRVARVAFDNVGCQQFVFRVRRVGNAVHSTIGEVIPNGISEINETAGWGEGGRHASAAEVVALLRGRGMNRLTLVWGSKFIAGSWIETNPTGELLTPVPGGLVVFRERHNVTHDGLAGSVGNDGVTGRSRRGHLDLVQGRCASEVPGSREHGV